MGPSVDLQFDVLTDTATLALFDDVALEHRKSDAVDWFANRRNARKEIAHGRLVLIPTPMDGEYRVRITTGGLSEEEEAATVGSNESFWIEVTGSRLRFGAAENLPGASQARIGKAGEAIMVPNGRYQIALYGLNTPNSPPVDPPNIVIRLLSSPGMESSPQPAKDPELWPKEKRARTKREHPSAARTNRSGSAVIPLRPGQPAEFACEMNTEMLGLYDPAELKNAAERPPEWTNDKTLLLAEARAGRLAFAYSSAIAFRTVAVRVQMDVLTIQQAAQVYAVANAGWFRVSSGEIYCAPSEEWPANNTGIIRPAGRVLSLDNGSYAATFHFLKPEKPRFSVIIEIRALGRMEARSPVDVVDALPLGFERRTPK